MTTPSLIDLTDAYDHLRIDFDSDGSDHDRWLQRWIPRVSDAVGRWLKDSWRLYELALDSDGEVLLDSDDVPVNALDSNGDFIVNAVVEAACLIELERQWRFRGGEGGETDVTPDAGHGYTLGKGATALLTPLRRSTVA